MIWCYESYPANGGRRCIVRKLNVAITFAKANHLFCVPFSLIHAGVTGMSRAIELITRLTNASMVTG